MSKLTSANKPKEARDATAKYAVYAPSANAQISLGTMDYSLGDKAAALADFRKALEMDPSVRRRFEAAPANAKGNGRMRAILDDAEFMKQLFPDKQ
jgi:Tfp pilus assembly protein PilF